MSIQNSKLGDLCGLHLMGILEGVSNQEWLNIKFTVSSLEEI